MRCCTARLAPLPCYVFPLSPCCAPNQQRLRSFSLPRRSAGPSPSPPSVCRPWIRGFSCQTATCSPLPHLLLEGASQLRHGEQQPHAAVRSCHQEVLAAAEVMSVLLDTLARTGEEEGGGKRGEEGGGGKEGWAWLEAWVGLRSGKVGF